MTANAYPGLPRSVRRGSPVYAWIINAMLEALGSGGLRADAPLRLRGGPGGVTIGIDLAEMIGLRDMLALGRVAAIHGTSEGVEAAASAISYDVQPTSRPDLALITNVTPANRTWDESVASILPAPLDSPCLVLMFPSGAAGDDPFSETFCLIFGEREVGEACEIAIAQAIAVAGGYGPLFASFLTGESGELLTDDQGIPLVDDRAHALITQLAGRMLSDDLGAVLTDETGTVLLADLSDLDAATQMTLVAMAAMILTSETGRVLSDDQGIVLTGAGVA